MRSSLWRSILLGFAATSTAIYKGSITSDQNAIGVVRVQAPTDEDKSNFGSGVVLGNGKCVITAAHVVKGLNPGSLTVFKNKKESNKIVRTTEFVTVTSIHPHPSYTADPDPNADASAYDFAVVELNSTMDASPWKVADDNGRWEDITQYGWGSISQPQATYPSELRSAVNKYRDITYWSQCKSWTSLESKSGICIMSRGSVYPTTAPPDGLNCGGDSGGPGVINKFVVGVASSTKGTCGLESQTAGLLAGLFGGEQNKFLKEYQAKCGFQFGNPLG